MLFIIPTNQPTAVYATITIFLYVIYFYPEVNGIINLQFSASESSVLVKYKTVVSGKTFDAHLQILDRIKSSGHGLNLVDVEKNQTGEHCYVTFVFCPNVSRVGTDIEAAMKEVRGEKKLSRSFMLKQHPTPPHPIPPNVFVSK